MEESDLSSGQVTLEQIGGGDDQVELGRQRSRRLEGPPTGLNPRLQVNLSSVC